MIWFCGGHGLCLTDAQDDQFVAEATVAWLDRWVGGDTSVDIGAPVVVQDDDGELHRFDSLPMASSTVEASGSGALELSTESLAGPLDPADAPGDLLTGIAASITPTAASEAVEAQVVLGEPTLVLGTPLLELTYRLEGVEPGDRPVRVFAQLVDDATGTVVGNQNTPVPFRDVAGEHLVEVPAREGRVLRRSGAGGDDHPAARRDHGRVAGHNPQLGETHLQALGHRHLTASQSPTCSPRSHRAASGLTKKSTRLCVETSDNRQPPPDQSRRFPAHRAPRSLHPAAGGVRSTGPRRRTAGVSGPSRRADLRLLNRDAEGFSSEAQGVYLMGRDSNRTATTCAARSCCSPIRRNTPASG